MFFPPNNPDDEEFYVEEFNVEEFNVEEFNTGG
jgi:hypothetical protein